MDYKKKYEQIIAKLKDFYQYDVDSETAKRLEVLFPELKESEDEKIRKELISLFQDCIDIKNHSYNADDSRRWLAWLEKQGEQKPAWSKEDEGELYLTISLLDKFKEEAYTNDCENCINWLKSIKPQPHWKPTQEQMTALKIVKNGFPSDDLDAIESLYNELEKL